MNTETIELLKEINSGCKAAVDSMDQVRTRITSPELKKKPKTAAHAIPGSARNAGSSSAKRDSENAIRLPSA